LRDGEQPVRAVGCAGIHDIRQPGGRVLPRRAVVRRLEEAARRGRKHAPRHMAVQRQRAGPAHFQVKRRALRPDVTAIAADEHCAAPTLAHRARPDRMPICTRGRKLLDIVQAEQRVRLEKYGRAAVQAERRPAAAAQVEPRLARVRGQRLEVRGCRERQPACAGV